MRISVFFFALSLILKGEICVFVAEQLYRTLESVTSSWRCFALALEPFPAVFMPGWEFPGQVASSSQGQIRKINNHSHGPLSKNKWAFTSNACICNFTGGGADPHCWKYWQKLFMFSFMVFGNNFSFHVRHCDCWSNFDHWTLALVLNDRADPWPLTWGQSLRYQIDMSQRWWAARLTGAWWHAMPTLCLSQMKYSH